MTNFLLFSCLVCVCLALQPVRLRVEYEESPVGLDVETPRFFWSLDNEGTRGDSQSAYQIIVTDSNGNQTSSGKVSSSQSMQITIDNLVLVSHEEYRFSVQVWNSQNQASNVVTSEFSTGVLSDDNDFWSNADWIGIPISSDGNQFRSEFIINSTFDHARCYIVSPNYYKTWINEELISDYSLGYFTTFEKRVYYDTFNCHHMLREGSNTIGIWLGRGWYSYSNVNVGVPVIKMIIRLVLSDGSINYIGTGADTFKQIQGPIRANDIYIGEWYDATYETEGWLSNYYNDSSWSSARLVSNPKMGILSSSAIMPKIKKVESYTAVSITEPQENIYVLDFGQNVAGFCGIKIPGNTLRGQNVTIIHSEELDPQGNVVQMYSNSPMISTYTLKGNGNEEYYEPSFTYYGYQYVQIQGFPTVPTQNNIISYFVRTDMDTNNGNIQFGESNVNDLNNATLLNNIVHMTRYAALSNYMNIPTDCPQRERRGWLGDAQLNAQHLLLSFDMASSYTKWLLDIQDSQIYLNNDQMSSSMPIPDVVPYYKHGGYPGDPSWTTAYINIIYWMYRHFNDLPLVTKHYDNMKAQLVFLRTQISNDILPITVSPYGDWCAVNNGPSDGCPHKSAVLNTFDYIVQCEYFAEMALAIGNTDDANTYSSYAQSSKSALASQYYDNTNGYYMDSAGDMAISTTQALALELGLPNTESVVSALVNDVVVTSEGHMTAGIVGTKFVPRQLCLAGYCEIAVNMLVKRDYPSYGYWYLNGATTLWENWQTSRYEAHGSKNHIMFGAQSQFYFEYLGGIRQLDNSTNWDRFEINPFVNMSENFGISFVQTAFQVGRGRIENSWQTFFNTSICNSNVGEGQTATLTCPNGQNGIISKVLFASYGTPTGTCGNFQTDSSCNNNQSVSIVESLCLGKHSCSIPVSNDEFGYDPCLDVKKHLDVEVLCTTPDVLEIDINVPVGSTANVYVSRTEYLEDDISQWQVTESGNIVWQNGNFNNGVDGVLNGVKINNDQLMFQVTNGQYTFTLSV